MSEKFKKRVMKWGLLSRPASTEGKWNFVNQGRFIFDTLEAALEKSNEFNTNKDIPNYLYKPIEVLLEIEVDK